MSSSTNSTKLSQKTSDFRQKYKTQRCRYWYERGFCPFNQLCAFAHTEEELRARELLNQNYKTKVCANFKDNGCCRYGDRCQFLHVHEAPVIYNRSISTAITISSTKSETSYNCSGQIKQNKHQKELIILKDYGLEVLVTKKSNRSDKWRSFLIEGIDPYEAEAFKLMNFEDEFPEYDFKRKPRLGSL